MPSFIKDPDSAVSAKVLNLTQQNADAGRSGRSATLIDPVHASALRILKCVVASVPAGRWDLLLADGSYVNFGFEPVQQRAQAKLLAADDGRAGSGAAVTFG